LRRSSQGLVVSEILWKETPVVAGEAGGIPLQMPDGAGGFLIRSAEECAERILHLLRHPQEGAELASRGREIVRERFLLPHLIADELVLYTSLLESGAAGAGVTDTRALGFSDLEQ
jgi:trehalose synthase